jgi:NAD(P)-dependent dehydrogenase (short-subunit alcohol dehydrogenase family)
MVSAPSFRLDGDVAFVTGAASGIGRSIAIGLAEVGAKVACCDLAGSDLGGVMKEVLALGGEACEVVADVTDPEQLAAAVGSTVAAFGGLTVAVNSAGIANASPAEDMPLEQWRGLVDVDFTGVFLSCQAEARVMLRSGRGAIVNIASMSGTIANRGILQAHYNASKAAVAHLSRSLAMEWADRGIRVNSISPGYTATPMNYRPEVAEQVKRFEADTPLGRMARPEEMVGPTIFLLSEAGSFCTGVDLLVDGGFTCW